MAWSRHGIVAALLLCSASPLLAAQDAANPDWPCVQRKIAEIMPASIWSGPVLPDPERMKGDPALMELLETVVRRRTGIEEAEAAIAAYAASHDPADIEEKMPLLMSGIFRALNRERAEILKGIERYAKRQKALAEKVRADNAALSRLRQGDASADEIAARSEQLLWDTRIFDERRRSLSTVCEVPVLIEQRLYALARAIQATLP